MKSMTLRGTNSCCIEKNIIKHGTFKRASDQEIIQRYRCEKCKKTFSAAKYDPAYRQNRRDLNHKCKFLIDSGFSLRQTAKILDVSLTTILRKKKFLQKHST